MKIFLRIKKILRKLIIFPDKLILKNKPFSLISRDCTGGVLLHEYGIRFNSPFINLYVRTNEFNTLCLNLECFMKSDLKHNIKESEKMKFPVGYLEYQNQFVNIYFNHHDTFDDAKKDWERRLNRIRFDNIFVLTTNFDRDYDDKMLRDFNKIKYPHILLTDVDLNTDNCFYVKKNPGLHFWNFTGKFSLRKSYDIIKFRKWIIRNYRK